MNIFRASVVAGAVALCFAGPAAAVDFSFTGSFTSDDDVQAFTFTADGASTVTLRAWSYAGGVNAAGNTIARGGFDPILALFDSTGALLNQNDDGGCGNVGADALTGACWDTFLSQVLAAGTYTVTVMEYDNFASGPNLSNGFGRDGQGNFTAGFSPGSDCGGVQFCDVSNSNPGSQRDGHWAFDVLNVEQAAVVPEPGSLALLGLALAGFGASRRLRKA